MGLSAVAFDAGGKLKLNSNFVCLNSSFNGRKSLS